MILVDGYNLVEVVIKLSLFFQFILLGEFRVLGQWWEKFEFDLVLCFVLVFLFCGIQVLDIVEVVDFDVFEWIILDLVNVVFVKLSVDVCGRYSIIVVGLDEVLCFEYYVGDDYVIIKFKVVGGMLVNLLQQVLIVRYGSIWVLIVVF